MHRDGPGSVHPSAPEAGAAPGTTPPRPVVHPPQPWSFPTPQRWTTSEGIRVQAYHLPGQHVLAVRLGIAAPVRVERPGQEGISVLWARCLDEGTDRLDAAQIAERFESRGIAWGAGAGERGLFADLDLTGEELIEGLRQLTDCLTGAIFPEAEVNRARKARLADIAHERVDPVTRAGSEFLRAYHPAGDRARLPLAGTASSIAALDSAAVRAHHVRWCRPDLSHLVIAGDLSAIDVRAAVDEGVADWRAPAEPRPVAPDPEPATRAPDAERLVFVDRPDSVQTEIYLGRPGPDRRDPHGWGTFQTLSLVIGGSPHSRLDRVLREELGYTYGMSAGFRPRARGGLFIVAGAIRDDVTAPALRELLTQVSITGEDLTAEEVRRAADFVARTAPGRYATADVVAAEALALSLDGLSGQSITDNLAQVATLDQHRAGAAWDAFADAGWTVVLVGRAEQHLSAVEALDLGPVSVITGAPEDD